MDSISTADLLELGLLLRDDIEDQFEFWLSVTFAVIAASFVAGAKLKLSWRAIVGGLYILTTSLFYIRFRMSGALLNSYVQEAIDRGAIWTEVGAPLPMLRTLIFAAGTIATIWFLYWNSRRTAEAEIES